MEEKKDTRRVINLKNAITVILQHKKRFIITWVVTFALSAAYILCIPRTYTASVSLAPEVVSSSGISSLSNLAASFGFDIGGGQGEDAIVPDLYPDLFSSYHFLAPLLKTKVTTQDGTLTTDYYTYLLKHQKKTPWAPAMSWLKGLLVSSEEKAARENGAKEEHIDPFKPNIVQDGIFQLVIGNVQCAVDKKTNVINITVQDQDPLIAATMADSARIRLQEFITLYRTNKARADLAYFEQLKAEAEAEYQKAENAYGRYADTHHGDLLASFQTERDKLENDMQIALQNLTAIQQQLQNTKAKVQETTPAFTIVQHSTVPIKATGPKRMIFVAFWLIFVTCLTYLWLIRKDLMA